MRHRTISALAFLAVLAACTSSQTYPVSAPPDVQIVQLYGPSDLNYSRGISSVEARYGLQITNNADEPIILKHVTLETIGGTTIRMRREDRSFNNEIPPGQTGQAVVNARVFFTSDGSGSPTREPITMRATLNFSSAKGSFNKIIQKLVGEFPQ